MSDKRLTLKKRLHIIKHRLRGKKVAPAFNAFHTFLYTPDETTHNGAHVRGADDLKRTMNTVIMALIPVLLFSSSIPDTSITRPSRLPTGPPGNWTCSGTS